MCSTAPHPSQTRMASSLAAGRFEEPARVDVVVDGQWSGWCLDHECPYAAVSMRALPGGSGVVVTRHTSAPGTCDVDSPRI